MCAALTLGRFLGARGAVEDAVFDAVAQRRTALGLPQMLRPQLPSCPELHLCPVGAVAAPQHGSDVADTNVSLWGNYRHTVGGGTFDRLHPGHKVLLSMAAAFSSERCVVDITHSDLLRRKSGVEFIQDVNVRCASVELFLHSVRHGLSVQMCVISDHPDGSASYPFSFYSQLEIIIVSDETRAGADVINATRSAVSPALPQLHVFSISLLQPEKVEPPASLSSEIPAAKRSKPDSAEPPAPHLPDNPSAKMSSTYLRKDNFSVFLDQKRSCDLFHPRILPGDWARVTDMKTPYVIGLTGGIASGKSTVRAEMQRLGAGVIDCDALGHAAYAVGTPTLAHVIKEFGRSVGTKQNGINRDALRKIVFKEAAAMKRLSAIVWPAIRQLLRMELRRMGQEAVKVVVVESAVLLQAGWDDECDEVWAVHVPHQVACQRLVARDSLTEEKARQRVQWQMPEIERLRRSQVIINSDQTKAETAASVAVLYAGLQQRLPNVEWGGGCQMYSLDWKALHEMMTKPYWGRGGKPSASECSHLRLAWLRACESFDVDHIIMRKWWRRLLLLYTSSGRYHHTIHHIRELCDQARHHRKQAQLLKRVVSRHNITFMAMFHDAVYDAASVHGDNESKSMQLWGEFARECGWSTTFGVIKDIGEAILATANHLSSDLSGDGAVFLDLDLEVLSRQPAE